MFLTISLNKSLYYLRSKQMANYKKVINYRKYQDNQHMFYLKRNEKMNKETVGNYSNMDQFYHQQLLLGLFGFHTLGFGGIKKIHNKNSAKHQTISLQQRLFMFGKFFAFSLFCSQIKNILNFIKDSFFPSKRFKQLYYKIFIYSYPFFGYYIIRQCYKIAINQQKFENCINNQTMKVGFVFIGIRICPICGCKIKSNQAFQTHIQKNKHIGKRFKSNSLNQKRQSEKCECGKLFLKGKGNLKRHKKEVCKSSQKSL